ncbi:MAG: acyltransferase [Enterococcus aquimarinus]|uniref:Acyltransferase n=1 Tax=Enterococcus aquimarinus TaxID=328396 RepID=A0A9E4DSS1_9ENTE|nr:acyltransferase [Enterococcus aquimarinus]
MNRDLRIDVVRVIACFIIVLTHILQRYGNEYAFWTNSAVCTFFVISGILLSDSKVDNPFSWIKKRVSKLIPEYYLVVIPMILIFIFFFDISKRQILIILLNIIALFRVPSGFAHLWFLTGIVIAYLITPFLIKKKKIVHFLLLIIVLRFLYVQHIFTFQLASGLFSYFLGLYFKKIFLKKNSFSYGLLFIGTIFFIGINLDLKYSKVLSDIRYSFLGLSAFYLIYHSNLVSDWLIKRWGNIILFFSQLSYSIYLVHGVFSQGPLSILAITKYYTVNIIFYLLTVFVFSVALNFISNKIVNLCKQQNKLNLLAKDLE